MSDLAEFHDELRSVARDLLAPASPLVTGGEPGRVDLSQLAKAGWLGLDVPEANSGSGATFAEVAVVLEEIGRAAAATPMLGAVLAVGALGAVEPSTARDQLLADIAEGEVRATVAVAAGDECLGARPGCAIERDGGSVRLSGRVRFVPDAPEADRVLVVADDPSSGPVLVEATPGVHVEVRPLPVVDATRSLGEVVATGAAVDPTRIWPGQVAKGMGKFHPVAWYHLYDGGRVFVTALGHTPELYNDTHFLEHVYGGLYWAATGKGMSPAAP